MIILGAGKLVACRQSGCGLFRAGSFVLLLKITRGFGTHLTHLNGCFIKLQRSAVSIARLSALLNIEEHHSLRGSASAWVAHDDKDANVVLDGIHYTLPEDSLGPEPMGALQMKTGKVVKVPLGRFVQVHSSTEGVQLTFLALIAGVVHPHAGQISYPQDLMKVMLMGIPVGCPDMAVAEALQIAGMPLGLAERFAIALDLRPAERTNRLPPGQAQLLAIVRAMLRDPAILCIVRPFAFLGRADRQRLQWLLRVWQDGGAARIVQWLYDGKTESPDAQTPQSERTLVITSADADLAVGPDCVQINLDDSFDSELAIIKQRSRRTGRLRTPKIQPLDAGFSSDEDTDEDTDGDGEDGAFLGPRHSRSGKE
eukprot:NODE_447_length_1558_cov_296.927478.p1 GENE.NODE_447_length_1558_cov_296.927478~~NODE_447_length_1558_cov_296.927478.p1  ORF type:complete len:409 (+),score=75.01 NODE_447_length_1558_cov_296.927478:123-1229(+)